MNTARNTILSIMALLALQTGLIAYSGTANAKPAKIAHSCTLPQHICASEGIVVMGPQAKRLVNWQRRTKFHAITLHRFQASLLKRLSSKHTLTLLLGREDLAFGGHGRLIRKLIERGGTVLVTDPTLEDADLLDRLAGLSGARWEHESDTALLYGLREVRDDEGRSNPMAFVLFAETETAGQYCDNCLNKDETKWLMARIGNTPPAALGRRISKAILADSINQHALAKQTSIMDSKNGESFEVHNTIYAARAFANAKDYYYVDQKVTYTQCNQEFNN